MTGSQSLKRSGAYNDQNAGIQLTKGNSIELSAEPRYAILVIPLEIAHLDSL
jgi:hypothetical protein